MTSTNAVVFLSDPNPTLDAVLRFRLTYHGELRPTQRDAEPNQRDSLASHKHQLRRSFHVQLRELWRTNKFLRDHRIWPKDSDLAHATPSETIGALSSGDDGMLPMAEAIARKYQEFGFRFVPLVREEISLLCSLKILFLRRDIPGSLISAGDIDNRLKTVIDALRRPRSPNEVAGIDAANEDDPFFCLMEDDSQVTHLEVETDTLLDPMSDADADHRIARLIITVELKPYHATMFNLSFS